MNPKSILKTKKGFTIIEVVLVLAIAGLIFLMVFIAYPPLARNQRDTQRRDDYATLSANVNNYMTNNNGKVPTASKDGSCPTNFDKLQLNKTGTDPDGADYELRCSGWDGQPLERYDRDNKDGKGGVHVGPIVYVLGGYTCDGGMPKTNKKARTYAVYGQLENDSFCTSSD